MVIKAYIEMVSRAFEDVFAKVAFAEAGELYQEHPHKMRALADTFAEVAFAESGESYPGDRKEETEAYGPVCINGETGSGFCV